MRRYVFFLAGWLFSLLTFTLSAQTVTGQILDTNGEPIPNATLYIRETTHGIMADEYGEFQIDMKKGAYTCEVSSLGYERQIISLTVPEEGTTLIVRLPEKTYALKEVTVVPGKEDPAYRIMRNVIANAPFHLNQVKNYESGVYIKGSVKVDKVSTIVKSQIKDKELREAIGELLLYESQSEVRYQEPNKYEQHVIAVSNSIPKKLKIDDNLPLSLITNNIYSNNAFGGLLAPGSFSVYKFKLEDSYTDNEHLIYKIQVIPRKKSNQLVSGHLYIVDENWTVQRANLRLSQGDSFLRFNLKYNEIKQGAFLPTALEMALTLDMMGIKGNGQFYASIKYNQLETNDNYVSVKRDTTTILKPSASTTKSLTAKQQKNLKKIEELAEKDNLTTREAYKMAQLVQKTVETDNVKEQKRQLEIQPLDSMIIVTRDSLALNRDSTFWSKTRIQPLRPDELQSYVRSDSIQKVADSLSKANELKNRSAGKWMTSLLFGEKIKFAGKFYAQYDGLLRACTEYNFVNGFHIGQRVETGVRFDRNRSLSIAPAVYYTTARKNVDFVIDGTLIYAPLRAGLLTVSGGNTLADYAGKNGTGRLGNSLASLLFAGNTAKFYQKKYVEIANKIDIANGLHLKTGFKYENRNDLDNLQSYNFFNKRPKSNRPHGQTDRMPDNEAYIADITLEYTPNYYYTIRKGKKYYLKKTLPTFTASYKRGFPGSRDENASFDNIEATIYQEVRLGLFDKLYYEFNAGTFLSSGQSYLPDYKHFYTNEMFMIGKSLNNSFFMDNYRYATNDKWLQAHVTYSSSYLLLKHLPFMQSLPLDEAIHLHTLWTPDINRNEIGYSIGLGNLGRLGVFVGFNELKHETTGFVFVLSLLNLLE